MMTEDFAAIRDKLEPGASAGGGEIEPYLVSLAISAKRIADALDDLVRGNAVLTIDVRES